MSGTNFGREIIFNPYGVGTYGSAFPPRYYPGLSYRTPHGVGDFFTRSLLLPVLTSSTHIHRYWSGSDSSYFLAMFMFTVLEIMTRVSFFHRMALRQLNIFLGHLD